MLNCWVKKGVCKKGIDLSWAEKALGGHLNSWQLNLFESVHVQAFGGMNLNSNILY